jgi:hypothetical protein
MDKDLVVKDEGLVVGGNLGMEGVEGFDMSDLPMPFVKLVHPTSKNTDLNGGGKAVPGTWYHTTKKEAQDSMDVVFFYAKKVKTPNPRDINEILDGVRILDVDLKDLESPFAMQFTKGGYWAYKRLLAAMKVWKMKSMHERYVLLGSQTVKSKAGDEFLVPTMDLSDPLKKDQLAKVQSVVDKFGGKIDNVVVEDDEEIEHPEKVGIDEVDLPGVTFDKK